MATAGLASFAIGVALTPAADAQAPVANQPGANLAMGAPAAEELQGVDCASGISIRIEFGHLCTEVCAVDGDCLAGWGCKVIEQGNGEPVGLCVPRRINVQTPAP
ncbi:MAG: hypothetical protein IPG45_13000 [Deltaproteobacteria bacterium]|nr:hypothetical protein [Deltaproteobacteria bacterium]